MTGQWSAPPNYERHTNLSINTKSASECHTLSDIRYEIDTIDHFIVKLIHHRLQYVLATLKFKSDVKSIPDNKRMIQQLNQRKKWAEEYGLDPRYIESLFKLMLDWYISRQIAYYKSRNPDEASVEVKVCSLNELKAIEFGLSWMNISHFSQLLSSGYRKARETAEPVLISFTQKTSIFSDDHTLVNVDPFCLFEQSRRLSLSHGFLLAQPSQQFFMLALGSVQKYDLNQNDSSFHSMNKKIRDFTQQEFHSEVKKVVTDGWKRLLLNAIIENCAQRDIPGCGPVLTGGLCFDHQNTCPLGKWSNFHEASFILPRVQFTGKDLDRYATFNIVVGKHDKFENEMEFINAEIVSLLQFCSDLLNGAKQHLESGVGTVPIDNDNLIKLTPELAASSTIWKQTVWDAIVKITDSDSDKKKKAVLVREAQIHIDQTNIRSNVGRSLKCLSSLHPSSYIFGVLRQGSCFFGATQEQLVRLHNNQFECTALAGVMSRSTNEIEDRVLETELFNSNKERHEHSLVVERLRRKLEPITEANSLSTPDKPMVLKLANLQHLCTHLRGTIRREITPLDLVQTLHPTLAISGLPHSDALKLIREDEKFDHGWYAAPVGWIDANNNGEFAVAVGSALIDEESVSLFTDCGNASDSSPADTLRETRLNMETMLLALSDSQDISSIAKH